MSDRESEVSVEVPLRLPNKTDRSITPETDEIPFNKQEETDELKVEDAAPREDEEDGTPANDDSVEPVYEVEKILDKRLNGKVVQYQVKWRGYSLADATWEPRGNLMGCERMLARFETKAPKQPIEKKPKLKKDRSESAAGSSQQKPKEKSLGKIQSIKTGPGEEKVAAKKKRRRPKEEVALYSLPPKSFKNASTFVDLDDSVHQHRENRRPEVSVEDSELTNELWSQSQRFMGFVGLLKTDDLSEPWIMLRFAGDHVFTTAYPLRIVRRVLGGKLLDWYETRVSFLPATATATL